FDLTPLARPLIFGLATLMFKTRRDFLKTAAGISVLAGSIRRAEAAEGWDQVPGILARIQAPRFAQRDFEITRYGATGDGVRDSTECIPAALAACRRAGGGRVLFPAGIFMTGPIHLKSNVDLHISSGATLKFLRDPSRYLPLVYSRWEGVECMNYSAFV